MGGPGSGVWEVKVTEIKDAWHAAQQQGKTPLLLDQTENKVMDTFFQYQNAQIVEAKKLIMQGRTPDGLAEVLDEARMQLVRSMGRGYTLYVRMTNSAADFRGKYNNPEMFPIEVMDRAVVEGALEEEITEQGNHPLAGVVRDVHKEFNVVVCSHFKVEDYEEFLSKSIPLDKCQAM